MDESKKYHILALEVLSKLKEGTCPSKIDLSSSLTLEWQKEAFCNALIEESKEIILKGLDFGFHAFDLAQLILPENAKIHFQIGVFLFDYGVHRSKQKYLQWAEKHIEKAAKIKPLSLDVWIIWADIFLHKGLLNNEMFYFQKACEKYEKAQKIAQDEPKYLKKFLWDWALCCFYLGKHSGEAIDIKASIDLFEQASTLGFSQENFWRDFGNAFVSMGMLISDERFLLKALKCFQKSIQMKPSYYKGWHSSANTFQKLYELTLNEEYLSRSHAAYGKASDLERDHHELWNHWGHLFLLSGRAKDDVKHLQMAAMKFEKAQELSPQNLDVLSSLSEAYSSLGVATSSVDYLKKAKKQIEYACEQRPGDLTLILRKGICFFAHGQYFDDTENYQLAIQTFEEILTKSPSNAKACFWLAQCYLQLGNKTFSETEYQKAHEYFKRASTKIAFNPELWNQWGMTHFRLAELLEDQENITQAIEKFEKALFCHGTSKPPALLLFNYGCALDFLGSFTDNPEDFEKSAKILNELLKLYPHFSCVNFNLALVYSHLGEMQGDLDYYSKALESFHKATLDDPEDSAIWSSWALSLMHYAMLINEPLKKDFYEALLNEAEKKLRKALALGSLEAYYQLSALNSLRKNITESLHFLQLASAKGASFDLEELNFDPRFEALRNSDSFHEYIQSSPLKEKFEDL